MKRYKKRKNAPIFSILIMLLAFSVIAFYFFSPDIQNLFNKEIPSKILNKSSKSEINEEKTVIQKTAPIQASPTIYASRIPFNEYKFKYTYDIAVKGTLKTLSFKMYVPQSEFNKYSVKILSISQKPTKYYKTDAGYIAEYNFANVANQTISVSLSGVLKTRTYDLALAKEINKNLTPENDLTPYLRDEKYIEVNDPYILKIAKNISGNSQEEIVDNIYKYVQDNLKYKLVPNIGAKKALKKNQGKCTEYAASMVTLCRAKNIPARVVAGDFMRTYNTSHAWVEVYYDKYGWVMYDPTHFLNTVVYRNGKRVEIRNSYNSSDTPFDYMVLRRNDIDNRAIHFTYPKNQVGKATISKKFEIIKIK